MLKIFSRQNQGNRIPQQKADQCRQQCDPKRPDQQFEIGRLHHPFEVRKGDNRLFLPRFLRLNGSVFQLIRCRSILQRDLRILNRNLQRYTVPYNQAQRQYDEYNRPQRKGQGHKVFMLH